MYTEGMQTFLYTKNALGLLYTKGIRPLLRTEDMLRLFYTKGTQQLLLTKNVQSRQETKCWHTARYNESRL